MKSLVILALVFAAAQARPEPAESVVSHSDAFPIRMVIDEIEGAPKYPAARVINGVQASRGQFPYQAAVYAGSGFCGGSLISPRWVLTAAHCAWGIFSFTVHLGAQAISDAQEAGRVVVSTRSKNVHSGYTVLLPANDVAVIDLKQDVPLSDLIQPIVLATGSDLFVGAAARVSGWGKTSDASNSISAQLNYADLTVITNAECRKTFGLLNVRSSNICTLGSDGRSSCNGDSGGPLIDLASGRQIGIVSYGSSAGCESGSPNGFARVTSFTDWISEKTGLAL
ncbi:hypothetical protein R5R35_006906 [Gryllus longicercus]|uniref:Peptidase S1 domain-containing protein n=1 Tax=Gryllus longicercus TaxID=2509291 RepID=A0AAN9Z7I0_9ORTH